MWWSFWLGSATRKEFVLERAMMQKQGSAVRGSGVCTCITWCEGAGFG